MKGHISLAAIAFALFLSGALHAQGLETQIKVQRPDFSGKWKLNAERSRFHAVRRDMSKVSRVLTIRQSLPAIYVTIEDPVGVLGNENFAGRKFILYADGRGDEFVASPPRSLASVTEWQGDKLVTHFYETPKRESLICIQELELSADRSVLNMTMNYTVGVFDSNGKATRVLKDDQIEYLILDRTGK